MTRQSLWRVVSALGLLGAVGCGNPSPTSDIIPVQGKVYYRGQPLVSGMVVFAPDADRGTHGELATGAIQPDGSFKLKSADKAGAVAGWHRVTVMAVELTPEPRALLPARYSDPRLSGLLCEVKAGRDNAINFNLE
jgi:hypothetical protein